MSIRRTYSAPLLVPRTFFGWKLPLWLSWIVGFTANYASRFQICNPIPQHTFSFPTYEEVNCYIYMYARLSSNRLVKKCTLYSWRLYLPNTSNDWHTINFIQNERMRTVIDKRIKLAAPYLNDIVNQYDLRTHASNDY